MTYAYIIAGCIAALITLAWLLGAVGAGHAEGDGGDAP